AAEAARKALNPERMDEAVPAFLDVIKHLRAAQAELKDTPEDRPAAELLAEKLQVAATGLAAAAGIGLDVATDAEALIPGQSFKVPANLWNSGGRAITGAAVRLVPSADWEGEPVIGETKDVPAGTLNTWTLQPAVPAAAAPSVPYFL